jgi:FKBP-type peptidyl-prolyl cis-trans isomerase SlyD
MNVQKDAVVTIDYELKDENGEVLDTSENNGELAYLHGHDNIVEGLEEALEGKGPGEAVEATVQPDKGYGEYTDSLVFSVGRDRLPEDVDLELGMQFEARAQDGQRQIVTLTKIGDDQVTLDGNHPLAGQTLHFNVTVKDVREATEEELSHGHAHTGNGHEEE